MDSIEWIILVTDVFATSRQFYKDTLGLPIVRESIAEQFVQFQMKHCYLAVYGRAEVEKLVGRKTTGKPGSAIYAFEEVGDVDAVYSDLAARGVVFIKKPQTQPWDQRTAYFTDPDGHIWEIQKWIKK